MSSMRTPPPEELLDCFATYIAKMGRTKREKFIEELKKHHPKEAVDRILDRARAAWRRMRDEAKTNESKET